jgi:riboflavin synthase
VLRVWVDAPEIAADLREGASIAVNGCCVTVEAVERTGFACALTPETLERTRFESRLVAGAKVNLERALRADARLEGHIVQGHVDGVGTVVSLGRSEGGSADLVVEVPGDLERYIVKKGSVAVDGISLTVAALEPGRFGVAVIPYTLECTNLAVTRPGDLVSLETDILARYVERLTGR